jgi:8-oxo-dGTP pyrophosphatase MutT (NUDIX family)
MARRGVSSGGVAVRRMRGGWWFAAIEPAGKPGVLALPKGLVDAGEAPLETALREVAEETGLHCRPLAELGSIGYVDTWRGQRVFKTVTFHLMSPTSGRIGDIPPAMRREVAGARWLPLDAGGRLSYRGERVVLQRARARLAR